MRHFALCFLFLAACSTSESRLSELLQKAPESWSTLDVGTLNVQVEEATSAEKSWPKSPLLVAIHILGGDVDTRSLVIEEVKNRGEGADQTTVVYIRDGFLDDSVRGDWHELDLRRQPDGTWRVLEVRAAYRCWRSGNTDLYQRGLCP
mgnify:FL=1